MTPARLNSRPLENAQELPLHLTLELGLPTDDSLQAQAKYSPYALPVKQMTFEYTRIERMPLEARG